MGSRPRAGPPDRVAAQDACPRRCLPAEPLRRRSPGSFVAIDWGLTRTGVVGTDIVQLLAGRIESGDLDPAELAAIEAGTLDGYRRGLETEGLRVALADLARSVDASLVLRCVFTARVLRQARPLVPAARRPRQRPSRSWRALSMWLCLNDVLAAGQTAHLRVAREAPCEEDLVHDVHRRQQRVRRRRQGEVGIPRPVMHCRLATEPA